MRLNRQQGEAACRWPGRSRPSTLRSRNGGFSLLEMVVAIAILGMALGALYQAVGGATRNVRTDEKYAYGIELARSLLARNTRVSTAGVNQAGETSGGFTWEVSSAPVDLSGTPIQEGGLQEIAVTVAWEDGRKTRQIILNSIVEGIAE